MYHRSDGYVLGVPEEKLEEEFDISIPDEAAEKIQKVGEAVAFIESEKGEDA